MKSVEVGKVKKLTKLIKYEVETSFNDGDDDYDSGKEDFEETNSILVVLCYQFHFVNARVFYLWNKTQNICVKITIKIFACLFFTALF